MDGATIAMFVFQTVITAIIGIASWGVKNAIGEIKAAITKLETSDKENAAEIADHLRDKRTVVLNMEETSKDVSRRILDFLSGAAYAQEGKVKKVALSTYIITPYNVDILGDLIDELENNGLYF